MLKDYLMTLVVRGGYTKEQLKNIKEIMVAYAYDVLQDTDMHQELFELFEDIFK